MSDDEALTEDAPEIGDIKDGYVLVCRGDDKPEEWAEWLGSLVSEYDDLEIFSAQHGAKLCAGRKYGVINGWQDFCEKIGVELNSHFWQGSLISGQYVFGWIKPKAIGRAKKTANEILTRLRTNMRNQVRAEIFSELEQIDDIDLLIERTCDDRQSLKDQIEKHTAELAGAQSKLAELKLALEKAAQEDTSALALECIRIAGALLKRERTVLKACPLVLWSNGVVYALTSRGGIQMPFDSLPWQFLQEIKDAGHPVVQVAEMTQIGGWIHGPVYRKGTPHISGWASAWSEVENRERNFAIKDDGQDSEHLRVVREIHTYFKEKTPKTPST